MGKTTNDSYRPDIDGLRAVAIISVLAFHAFPDLLRGGFVGVDIFFVISGFLISSIIFKNLSAGKIRLREFYVHRINRIFPALILVFASCYIFGWFYLLPSEFKQLGKHMAAGAGFVQNLVLLRESGYFDTASELKPLMHLWSLAVEEQFYFVYPLLVWIVWRARFNMLAVLSVLLLLSFGLNIASVESKTASTFFLPHFRFWELLSGGLLAWLQLFKRTQIATLVSSGSHPFRWRIEETASWNSPLSVLGLSLIVLSIFYIRDDFLFPGWWALVPVAGAFFLILSGPNAWVNRQILANKFMVKIGLISYPLYLWHWPILVFLRFIVPTTPSPTLKVAAIVISVLLAWITYSCVEKPIRFGSRHWLIPVVLSLTLAALGYVGFNTWQRNGLPFRERAQDLKDFAEIVDVYEYFGYKKLLRVGTCHSVSLVMARNNGCIQENHPSIFVWGDSYAAALYGGLSHLVQTRHTNYTINQLTDGNGPPFFDVDKKTDEGKIVKKANEDRLQAVAQTRPEVVLISWMLYGANGITDKKQAVASLARSIQLIKDASPKSRVIVVGPVPEWKGTLVKQIVDFYRLNGKKPPKYMSFGINRDIKPWDDYLKINIPIVGAEYISAYDQFCDGFECLTRTSDNPLDLMAVDWGHLSGAGSIYLMEKIENSIFGDL